MLRPASFAKLLHRHPRLLTRKQLVAGVFAASAWVMAASLAAQAPQLIVTPKQDTIPRTSATLVIEPMHLDDKARFYARNTFSPFAFAIPALPDAIILADPPGHYPHDWKDGAPAFGRNFGDCFATSLAASTGTFVAGTITHEDPRYYPDRSSNKLHRMWHAVAFTVIDRSDHGNPTFAFSNFAGAASAGFVGRAYLPAGYNDVIHAGQRSAGALGGYAPTLLVGYATQNILYEFTPDLKRVARKMHIPFVPAD